MPRLPRSASRKTSSRYSRPPAESRFASPDQPSDRILHPLTMTDRPRTVARYTDLALLAVSISAHGRGTSSGRVTVQPAGA